MTREGLHCWCQQIALVPPTRNANAVTVAWEIWPKSHWLIRFISFIFIFLLDETGLSHSRSENALFFGHFHACIGMATQFKMVYLQQYPV